MNDTLTSAAGSRKIKSRATLPVAALIVLAAAVVSGTAPFFGVRAEDGTLSGNPNVFVPSFWDPSRPLDKPDLEGLTTMRFVTEDDYPPFGFTGPDGALMGFNVDLARALCTELKVSCTIQTRRYDTILPAVRAGAADAAIASIAITPQALESVDFAGPYYKTPARFAARRDSQVGDILPETIGARRIGVERGTAHEAFLKAFFSAADVRPFGTAAELKTALASGAVDLVFGDGIALAQWMQSSDAANCCVFAGGPFTESRFFGEGAGIAVRKGNATLRAALDYGLARLAAQGIYADLYLKYFPISVY